MRRKSATWTSSAALVALAACASSPAPAPVATPTPAAAPAPAVTLVAKGDWVVSPSEPYKGKQDDVYFVSPTVGYYGNGKGKLFKTTDGGASWTKILEKPGTYWRALGFLDEQHGFAGNIGPDAFPGVTDSQLLYRTDDGGATWAPVVLPSLDGARGVCAIDILQLDTINAGHRLHKQIVHVGGRVGGPAALFASDDGGATWTRQPLPPEIAMILDVKFLDPSIGFVFAGTDPDVEKSHGLIEKTSDGGRTWKKVYESTRPCENMWKGTFSSRQIGYATLQNYTGEAAQDPEAHVTPIADRFVVKTTDGGETWRELPVVQDAKMQEFGIGFVDDLHGWIGAAPTGYETLDGGTTWKPSPNMPKYANKLRIVRDPDNAGSGRGGAHVWAIGADVRHLDLVPAQAASP